MFYRITIAASAAFTLGAYLGPAQRPVASSIAVALLLMLSAGAIARRRRYAPFLVACAFFLAGFLASAFRLPRVTSIPAGGVVFEGVVVEAPEVGIEADGLIVDVTASSTSSAGVVTATSAQPRVVLAPASGRVRVRVPHPPGAVHPAACAESGELVRVFAEVRPLTAPMMPLLRSQRLAVRRAVALAASAPRADACENLSRTGALGWARSLRAAIGRAIDRGAPRESAGLLHVFATGDRAGVAVSAEERYARAGMAHFFLLSGLYAGAILLMIFALFRRLLRTRRAAAIACAPIALMLAAIYGATPTMVRMALILGALLFAAAAAKPDQDAETAGKNAWTMISIAVVICILWDPAALGDVAFQLPFAAIAAWIRTYPELKALAAKKIRVRLPVAALLFGVSIAVGTAPLIARIFDRVTLYGLTANVVALPLASFAVAPLALAGGLAGCISDTLGAPLLTVAGAALTPITALASSLSTHSELAVPTPTMTEVVLFYSALLLVFPPRELVESKRWIKHMTPQRLGIIVFAAIAVLALGEHFLTAPRGKLHAAFLPASKGRAVAVELPEGGAIVASTAPLSAGLDLGERAIANYLRLHRRTHVTAIFIARADAHHVDAARDLARQLDVAEIWWLDKKSDVPEQLQSRLQPDLRQRFLADEPPFERSGVHFALDGRALSLAFGGDTITLDESYGAHVAGIRIDPPPATEVAPLDQALNTADHGLIVVETDGRTLHVVPFRAVRRPKPSMEMAPD